MNTSLKQTNKQTKIGQMLNQSECTDKNSTVALTGTRTPGLPRSKAVHTLQPSSPPRIHPLVTHARAAEVQRRVSL